MTARVSGSPRSWAPQPRTTVFTKNVTEAINLVAYAWGRGSVDGRPNVGPGDAVLITQLEHHANIVPWQGCAASAARALRYLEVDDRGELSLEQLDAELARGDVRLVAFSHVSNVLGTIVPVAEMTARIRAAGRRLADRRRPGRAAHAGGRRRDRRGLLRLDGPQGAWADRHRRAARPRGDPGADGAVHDGRRHDLLGRLSDGHLERAAVQVRGRHAPDRRGGRAGRGRRLPVGAGHGACARARAGADRLHARPPRRGSRPARRRPARGRAPRAASRRSRSRASTPTTSPSWPTAAACASAPVTTARSR